MINHLSADQFRDLVKLAEAKDEFYDDQSIDGIYRRLSEPQPERIDAVTRYIDDLPTLAKREVAELFYLGTGTTDSIDIDNPSHALSDDQIAEHIGTKSRLSFWLRKGMDRTEATPIEDSSE